MAVDTFDIAVLAVILLATFAYFTKGTLWAKPAEFQYRGLAGAGFQKSSTGTSTPVQAQTRDILERMAENGKKVVMFYGSQTGTAEDYASRLAKEAASRYGLATMTADLEDYDFENLDNFPEDAVACFFMASYGEGEPTDNAADFWQFITDDSVEFSNGQSAEDTPLRNLTYVVFGLGNNTYEFYNAIGRGLDKRLEELGAKRLGVYGEGDDGSGTMEEDYLAWKDDLLETWAKVKNLEEREAVYEPSLEVVEKDISSDEKSVYLGEINRKHLVSAVSTEEKPIAGPFNVGNPYPAPVAVSKELFNSTSRNCIHMEFDISDSGLRYSTGDHLAVWPQNSSDEVDRFLQVFGLASKKDQVIDVKALDPTAKVPFPVPTTYDAVVRYHLEINGAVSRQLLSSIAPFAPSEGAKAAALELGNDKDLFHKQIVNEYYNTALLLSKLSDGQSWSSVPFSFLIENFQHLQPRYYSISSSSSASPNHISITAVVENMKGPSSDHELKGVSTNYILAAKQVMDGRNDISTYDVSGPRGNYSKGSNVTIPVHVRHSNFKLPSNPQKPIIMVGPGTGVAPFRGFIHEREVKAKSGTPVGKALLFFGCRNSTEDYIYADEWKQIEEKDGSFLQVIPAFSREGSEKVYVQHMLEKNGALVNKLLEEGAFFYVCGDASRMAHDVQKTLARILIEHRGLNAAQADEKIKSMKLQNFYQEDVW